MIALLQRRGWRRALTIVLGAQVWFWGFYAVVALGLRAVVDLTAMAWVAVGMGVVLGSALLVLLPLSRYSRLQVIAGLFLILVGADAWLTAFGATALPYAWFPLLRYGVEYLMLMAMALTVNGFAGWSAREAKMAGACYVLFLAILIGTMALGLDVMRVVPWLDAAALGLLLVYGFIVLLHLGRTAPGPAIRILALLLVGLASAAYDLLLPWRDLTALQASVLSPPLLMFGVLFEIAIQGSLLNQEAEEARGDLERQVLEQDANLLRSSRLLRHQELQIAINAERQTLLRDMHDGVGGMLTHLLLELRERRLSHEETERGVQAAIDDLRNIANAIDAGHEPLDEALAIFHERMAARLSHSGVTFDWRCQLPMPAPSLDARRLLSLHRLLQEGIANVLRHAGASHIELVAVMEGEGNIVIMLSDDGAGFDPANAKGARGEGCGLANMRRRAEQMGGRLRIESAPGRGTRLALTVPVHGALKQK
jgi:signal transduction histidine kinase